MLILIGGGGDMCVLAFVLVLVTIGVGAEGVGVVTGDDSGESCIGLRGPRAGVTSTVTAAAAVYSSSSSEFSPSSEDNPSSSYAGPVWCDRIVPIPSVYHPHPNSHPNHSPRVKIIKHMLKMG